MGGRCVTQGKSSPAHRAHRCRLTSSLLIKRSKEFIRTQYRLATDSPPPKHLGKRKDKASRKEGLECPMSREDRPCP